MAHHAINVILRIAVKGCPLRTDLSYILMVLLTMRFLPGTHRITVVDTGTDHVIHAAFQYIRVCELTSPVGQYQWEGKAELDC